MAYIVNQTVTVCLYEFDLTRVDLLGQFLHGQNFSSKSMTPNDVKARKHKASFRITKG